MNTLKTGILLAVIGAIAVGIGALFFRLEGAIIGLLIALAFQLYAYFNGAKMALAMAQAQPLPPGQIPWLDQIVDDMARRADIPVPPIYLSPDPQPNAFAAGRDPEHAVVCVNAGLLQTLTHTEIEAVLGHEFGHVKNRDILTMTIAAACATMISFIANIGFFFGGFSDRDRNPIMELLAVLVAPIAATMIQLAISRTREYAADAASARFLGSPDYMISALQRLERTTPAIPSSTAQTSTAHMYIASPFNGGGLAGLFATHPPLEERIRRLEAMR